SGVVRASDERLVAGVAGATLTRIGWEGIAVRIRPSGPAIAVAAGALTARTASPARCRAACAALIGLIHAERVPARLAAEGVIAANTVLDALIEAASVRMRDAAVLARGRTTAAPANANV